MAQIITNRFFDDCEGIVNVGGRAFWQLPPDVSGGSYTFDEFKEKFGLSDFLLNNPKHLTGIDVIANSQLVQPTDIGDVTIDIGFSGSVEQVSWMITNPPMESFGSSAHIYVQIARSLLDVESDILWYVFSIDYLENTVNVKVTTRPYPDYE